VAEPEPVVESEPILESVLQDQPLAEVQSVLETVVVPAQPANAPIVYAVEAAATPVPIAVIEPIKTKSVPQPLTPPAGSKPSVHTSSLITSTPKTQTEPVATATSSVLVPVVPVVAVVVPKVERRKLSTATKATIAAVLGLIIIISTWVYSARSAENLRKASYDRMIAAAAVPRATEVPVNKTDLDILLEALISGGTAETQAAIYKALVLAKANDKNDIDAKIVEFAIKREMSPDIREILIRDVLSKRKNPSTVEPLMAFALATNDTRSAVAAIQAVRLIASDAQCDLFLKVIVGSGPSDLRNAAEVTLSEIIKKSKNRSNLATLFLTAYGNKLSPEQREAVLRLLGRCGGPKALEFVKKSLNGADENNRIAAIIAMGNWGDDSVYPLLIDFIAGAKDIKLRVKAFDSALTFAVATSKENDSARAQKQWAALVGQAKLPAEKISIIDNLANLDDPWAVKMIEDYKISDDANISQHAMQAIAVMKKRKLINSKKY
jgi:hypothetical protein